MTWPAAAEEWIRAATFVPIVLASVVGFGLALTKWRQYRQPALWTPATQQSVFAALEKKDYERVRRIAGHDSALASRLVSALVSDDRYQ